MSWKGSLRPICGLRSRAGRPGRGRSSCRHPTGGLPDSHGNGWWRQSSRSSSSSEHSGSSGQRSGTRLPVPPSPHRVPPTSRRVRAGTGSCIQFADMSGSPGSTSPPRIPGRVSCVSSRTRQPSSIATVRRLATFPASQLGRRTAGGWRSMCLALGAIRDPARRRGLWVVGAGGEPRRVRRSLPLMPSGEHGVGLGAPRHGGRLAFGNSGEGELSVFDPSDGARRSLGRVDGQITALCVDTGRKPRSRSRQAALSTWSTWGAANGRGSPRIKGSSGKAGPPGDAAGIKWSPDGTRVMLVTERRPTSGPQGLLDRSVVQVLDAEGAELFVLPVPGGGRVPSRWSVVVSGRHPDRLRHQCPISQGIRVVGDAWRADLDGRV